MITWFLVGVCLWDPKLKAFLDRYGYMLNSSNNNYVWTRRLAATCSQEKKDNFFNSVKWMIVNVTKLAPVNQENTLSAKKDLIHDSLLLPVSSWEIPPFLKENSVGLGTLDK